MLEILNWIVPHSATVSRNSHCPSMDMKFAHLQTTVKRESGSVNP